MPVSHQDSPSILIKTGLVPQVRNQKSFHSFPLHHGDRCRLASTIPCTLGVGSHPRQEGKKKLFLVFFNENNTDFQLKSLPSKFVFKTTDLLNLIPTFSGGLSCPSASAGWAGSCQLHPCPCRSLLRTAPSHWCATACTSASMLVPDKLITTI